MWASRDLFWMEEMREKFQTIYQSWSGMVDEPTLNSKNLFSFDG